LHLHLKHLKICKLYIRGLFLGMHLLKRYKKLWFICAGVTTILIITGNSCNLKVKDNAIDKVTLGRYLFYDRKLTYNQTKSCGTCHDQKFAFTDGYKKSLGIYADVHKRNASGLFNVFALQYLTAADSNLHSPFMQMNNPMFHENPTEMGIKGHEKEVLLRIQQHPFYIKAFATVFNITPSKIDFNYIKKAIEAFVLSIRSENSLYDAYIKGDTNALTATQKKGLLLYSSKGCNNCHGGLYFNTPVNQSFFANTGLYNIGNQNAYPKTDMGLYEITKQPKDMGSFRIPTLRNIAFTAPYYHDGSAATLTEVIDDYNNGGRNITAGEYKGDGRLNKYKHPLIQPLLLNSTEKQQLIDFLFALSDSSLLTNTQWVNPY
jgi:cytochrome c peroxidase